MQNGPVMLHVDISQLTSTIERMRAVHTKTQFERLMYRAFKRTGSRMRTILKKELPPDYHAGAPWIGRQVGEPRTAMGTQVSCSIPVDGARGKIGTGGAYKASASAGGSRITTGYSGRKGKRTRRAYKVNASVVKSGASALPNDGQAVHFMVFKGPKRGRVFARLPGENNRIRPAVGIGVPQMPTTRSREAVQEGIAKTLQERIEHEHAAIIKGWAK